MSSENRCKKCGKIYTDTTYKWCKPCQTNIFRKNLANWTSGIERFDSNIQKFQLNINYPWDMIYEWIPFGQLKNITKVSKGINLDIYSATWKDGPLKYNENKMEYIRESNKDVFTAWSTQSKFTDEV